jgi:hypothetical protein
MALYSRVTHQDKVYGTIPGIQKKRRPKKCAAKQKIASPNHIPVPIRRSTSTVRILAQLGRLDMAKRIMIPKPENTKKIKRKLR